MTGVSMVSLPAWLPLWAAGVIAFVAIGAVAGGVWLLHQRRETEEQDPIPGTSLDDDLDSDEEDPQLVELNPPLRRPDGLIRSVYRHYREQSLLRKRGYVKWYLVGSGWPRPKFVKPERKNGGIPEVEYKGDWYLFPEESAMSDDESGMWTYVHRVGDAKPIDPRDPADVTLDADTLADYATRRPAASKPSWLSKFDLGEVDPLKATLAITIAIAVGWRVLG